MENPELPKQSALLRSKGEHVVQTGYGSHPEHHSRSVSRQLHPREQTKLGIRCEVRVVPATDVCRAINDVNGLPMSIAMPGVD